MKDLLCSLLIFIFMSLLTGLAYPFIITGISDVTMPQKAKGSLIISSDKVIGSNLIGQAFSRPAYFHGRPSALDKAYDAGNSGGSNAGPSNGKFLENVKERIKEVRTENGLEPAAPVPADMVLASASGLDPHISVDAAMVQVERVAKERGFDKSQVQELVQKHIEDPILGFIGQKRLNVLQLNLDLDRTLRDKTTR
jgi:potassium-transporting ATPase KdpC subunit